MTLEIPIKVLSLNDLLGKSKWVFRRTIDDIHLATWAAIESSKAKPVRRFPVTVRFHASWKGKQRHDIDALFCKPVLDQIVRSGLLPDDSIKYIAAVVFTGETGAKGDFLRVDIDYDEKTKI